jgi:hypothetical protein
MILRPGVGTYAPAHAASAGVGVTANSPVVASTHAAMSAMIRLRNLMETFVLPTRSDIEW